MWHIIDPAGKCSFHFTISLSSQKSLDDVFFSVKCCIFHKECMYYSKIIRESSLEITEAAYWK